MAQEVRKSEAAGGIQSEEDLQRMIDQEAWYDSEDSDDESSVAAVEADYDSDSSDSEVQWCNTQKK